MDAFERFLATYPDWRGKVTYLQITPKSRSRDPGICARWRASISTAAGHINGTYGEVAWTPIRYVNRAYSRRALAGLYRAARAALVTPLRDGMNLVAKEYIAAQDREIPGVLILSRFAGAAAECAAALHRQSLRSGRRSRSSIARALSMPLEERRARNEALFKVIAKNDIFAWSENFLAALTNAGPSPTNREETAPQPVRRLGAGSSSRA